MDGGKRIPPLSGGELPGRTDLPEELLRVLFPGIKVRRNDRYTPYAHIYLTTKRPEKSCNSKEKS